MEIPALRDLLNLSGKTAVVTGGGAGIGAAIAVRFAEAGANIVVNFHSSAGAAATVVAQVNEKLGKAVAVQADVSTPEGVQHLVGETLRTFGSLDVLVNNAGAYPLMPLLEMTPEHWDSVINANLRTVHLCTQAAALKMAESGKGGAIVNIASIEADMPIAGHSHYCSSKAAVLMHTRTAARELGRHGIRVNAVSPGLIWRQGLDEAWPEGVRRYKAAVPLSRLGDAFDIADACVFLASPASRWTTGANLVVDGGVMTNQTF